ncbi:MAG: exopolyphosphatase / guanosine-5-triphosphate,3-diphosphate pyrophosphatase [Actinomycetota bacterium]|nr:exopolyphosphatase / guanosine-5-triphosphate,3-diphosphate pyrophosphatase [Actinomycetota bacterium]
MSELGNLGGVAQRELRAADLHAVREQIGRDPTTAFTVLARCSGGHPLVIRNAPIDANGDPFPTTFWLTCPEAVKAIARVESEGWISNLNDRVQVDEAFDEALEAAHRAYAVERSEELETARAWGGVAGTRTGVKCLHAHYAYRIAGGDDPVGAWVAERIEPIHPDQRPRVAAIDQGTNSCRLLIVEPGAESGDPPTELARDMVITRLGQGVDRTGELQPDALERATVVLGRYGRRAKALGVQTIRVAATSAVRDASNRDRFADLVRTETGAQLEILDGEREAGLSFLGATHGLDPALGPFVVMDIGGGSTELVVGATPGLAEQAISTQLGSVRHTERVRPSDPPTSADLAAFERGANAAFDKAEPTIPVREARTLVSCAGTATTMLAVHLGLARYDPDLIHRQWLTVDDAETTLLRLARMTNAERAALAVMVPGRGDVIVAGAVILVTAMRRFGFERTLVSETDILDGLTAELLGFR